MSIVNPTNNLADALEKLGNVSLQRIRMIPAPGTATPDDVEEIRAREKRLFELVDGILVEKTVGFRESLVATFIARVLGEFVSDFNLGLVVGADGMMRLFDNTVRISDVAYVSWDRLPNGRVPEVPVPALAPSIAVEVLSQSNTVAEMSRKREEYFSAGVRQVWEIDIRDRIATIYIDPETHEVINEQGKIRCDELLPGFELDLARVFAELDRHQ